jgi:signal transduction histidine kinase
VSVTAMTRRRTTATTVTWLPALAGPLAVAALFLVAPDSAQRALRAAIDLGAGAAVLVALRVRKPEHATPWRLLGSGLCFAALGDTAALYYEHVAQEPPPFPSLADAGYLLTAPFFGAAILLVARHHGPGRYAGTLLDAGIVATAFGLIGTVFVTSPHLAAGTFTETQEAIAMTYPSMDVVVLTLAALLLYRCRSAPLAILTSAFAVLLATDVAFLVTTVEGSYRIGSLVDAGWLLTAALVAAAAWHPAMEGIGDPVPESADSDRLGRGRVALLFGAGLAFPLVLSRAARFETRDVPGAVFGSSVLLVLIFIRLYLITRDLAALRARRDLAERQTQFATMAAHELRTPLTALRGSLSTLQRARGLPDEHKDELVSMALRQSERLGRLSRDLEVVVHSEAGGLAVDREPVAVADVARDAVAALGAQAAARTKVDVPGSVTADADADRLAQVLDNLLRNALQHAPGSAVSVTAEEVAGTVVLEVADDGPGLPAEMNGAAFERFRLRGTDATGGFGLGLWIVRELVTAMGGDVAYDGSRGGAIFRVTLRAAL